MARVGFSMREFADFAEANSTTTSVRPEGLTPRTSFLGRIRNKSILTVTGSMRAREGALLMCAGLSESEFWVE